MMLNLASKLTGWGMFGPFRKERTTVHAPAGNNCLPDRQTREVLLANATHSMSLAPDVDLALLADTTTGLTAAELVRLCEVAGRTAAAEGTCPTTMAHFAEALDVLVLAGARPMLLEADERSQAAYHEAGHAIVAWLTAAAAPPPSISILTHAARPGSAPGPTGIAEAGERPSRPPQTARDSAGGRAGRGAGGRDPCPESLAAAGAQGGDRPSLLARLDVLLGGPEAEELAIGQVGDAGQADGRQAAVFADQIAARWGSAAISGSSAASQPGADGGTRLLDERRAAVRDLLERARPALDRLAGELIAEETLDVSGFLAVLGPR